MTANKKRDALKVLTVWEHAEVGEYQLEVKAVVNVAERCISTQGGEFRTGYAEGQSSSYNNAQHSACAHVSATVTVDLVYMVQARSLCLGRLHGQLTATPTINRISCQRAVA